MVNKKDDTNSYKGWLNSDSFLKRVMAITGYGMVGQFIIWLAFMVPLLIIAIAAGVFSMASMS